MFWKSLTSSPICETVVNTISWQFPRVSGGQNEVTDEAGVDNLHDDVLVREADDKAVFGCVVLVLGLGHKAFAGIVWGRYEYVVWKLLEQLTIGFALSASAVLDLETREVGA